jgi:hypothetical protein
MSRIAQFNTDMLQDWYTQSAAIVYGYLRWITYKTWWNWSVRPSIWLMVKTLHISRSSIIRWIQELEDNMLIWVDRWYKIKNTYYVEDMRKYPACCDFDDSDWD